MTHRWISLAVAAAMVALPTLASAQQATSDVAAELAAMKARIAELEAKQAQADGAKLRANATDAAIKDASQRNQFPQDDKLATGWDKGFKIGSPDGLYLIQPYVEFQFRNVTNFADDDGPLDSNFVNGFEVRRAKVGVRGNAFSKDFKYNFRLSVDRASGESILDYAYGEYALNENWGVRFGQIKLNWTREETVSDIRQLAAERSLFNQILGGGNTMYVQGVSLLYGNENNPFRGELQFTDGDNTSNTTFTDFAGADIYQDFGVAVRGEYKFFGNWDAYSDFTALKTKEDLLVAGVGADWAQGGDGDVYRFTADLQYENPNGLGAYGAAIYTIAEGDTGEAALDDSIGGLAQVGYLLPNLKDYEVFGRYSIIHFDEEVSGEDNFHEATLGLNKYFVGHNAKFTIDLNWLPNGSPGSAGGLGYSSTAQEQIVLRTQIQIVL